ncbi:MAG: hypothetical protein JO331_14465 [Verrucomicrobia bacterium]|nr:hypothetical protein [Verrucomicrobiota bacterium]
MTICVNVEGQWHCYEIPIIVWPVPPHRPGPGPINYPQALLDATLLASAAKAAESVSDSEVRAAFEGGINAAFKALQKRAGTHVKFEATAGGKPSGGGAHGPGQKG